MLVLAGQTTQKVLASVAAGMYFATQPLSIPTMPGSSESTVNSIQLAPQALKSA